MIVSVIPSDQTILVNGEPLQFVFAVFPPGMRAMQWNGVSGSMEFDQGPNQFFDNPAFVQPYIDAWNAEKARIEAEQVAPE